MVLGRLCTFPFLIATSTPKQQRPDLLYSSWVVVSLDSTVHPTTIVASCPCICHQLPLQKTRTMPLLFPVGRLNISSPAPKGWDLTNQALSECMTPLYPNSSL